MRASTEFVVEEAALAWLEATDWQVAHGPEIAPDTPAAERADYGEVVLAQRLRDALARLDAALSAEAVEDGEDSTGMAVEVMRESVPERRADGSPSPKVGAVLVRPDRSVVTGARGELRDGNHAELIDADDSPSRSVPHLLRQPRTERTSARSRM